MESPSKIDRRQAWALSSSRKLTFRDTEHRNSTAQEPHRHFSLQDDVFLDGCSAGKIETWLQGCGNEASPAKTRHLTIAALRTGTSFEDDLSLGAEALYAESDVPQFRTPQQKLNLSLFNMGHSIASTALSSTTNRTVSSVSEVLQMRAEDAEDTLFQLGFGCEEPQVTARIPVRFLNFPSQLRGINFRLFLESQLSRIRQEDPCLSLASRFRQVEALTAMANAFYSLYSHVSRTPLQKLAPPQFTFTSPIVERTMSRTSVRSEPRSPVERLKDTISKMCLYTGSRGSDSVTPSGSPRKRNCSLSSVVEKGVEGSGNDDANNQGTNQCLQMEVGDLESDMDCYINGKKDIDETCETKTERTDSESVTKIMSEPTEDSRAMESVHNLKSTLLDCTPCQEPRSDIVMESKGRTSLSVNLKSSSITVEPVPIISHDVISPQVVEYVNQASYRCLQTNNIDDKDLPFVHQMTNKHSIRPSNSTNLPIKTAASPICITPLDDQVETLGIALADNCPSNLSSMLTSTTQKSLCQITITGWEDEPTLPNRDIQQTCSSSIHRFLRPTKPLNLSKFSQCPKQANSFELEEVHSAEEEEAISSELCSTVSLSVSTQQHKSSPLRGDSFQSDSSGYAEEDVQHSPLHHGENLKTTVKPVKMHQFSHAHQD
ncbi:protein ITPRID2 [Xyrauchen texanus]|uniref:protein ITPRID2 n=1 Tax=Xyrauchen texanus TaxID=154827 RepID=UPI002242235E|nr:protein ITPRID2 [Xyrauchen texanus]XP_051986468.1 protein ITPRID2 [Xyrauchen texanus]